MKLTLLAAASAAAVMLASPAFAVLQISVQSGGFNSTCVDNNACDLLPATGNVLSLNTTVNGVNVIGQFAASTTNPDNLSFSNLTITNTTGSTQTVELAAGDTGFLGTINAVNMSGSATFSTAGDSGTLSFFADAANGQGAGNPIATPGTPLFSTSATAASSPDSFAGTSSAPFVGLTPFSMTEDAVFTIAAGATVTGFNMDMIAVPETSTWVMMVAGFGLLGLAAMRRNRAGRFAL